MIVARPYQEGGIRCRIKKTGEIKVRLNSPNIKIAPKINIFHGSINPHDIYEGPYIVTPRLYNQHLETKDKTMSDDVTVYEIPVTRTTNPTGGLTVLIG